jgi:hypothetical protein
MSIAQSHVVDAIGVDVATGDVVMTIIDHLDWDAEGEHLRLLQDKLNTYAAFIEAGELQEKYPNATGRGIRIDIVGRFVLSEDGQALIENARELLRRLDVAVTFRVGGAKTPSCPKTRTT